MPLAKAYESNFGEQVMQMVGITFQFPKLPIVLVDAFESSKATDLKCEGTTTTCTVTHSNGTTTKRVDRIEILSHLNPEHFEGVLAHEFGHVWLCLIGNDHLDDWEAEGFCQLLKYLWLCRLGTPEANMLMKQVAQMSDPVYGKGFEIMYDRWNRGGLSHVLQALGLTQEPLTASGKASSAEA